jgi:SAM-dependent methyltransferase
MRIPKAMMATALSNHKLPFEDSQSQTRNLFPLIHLGAPQPILPLSRCILMAAGMTTLFIAFFTLTLLAQDKKPVEKLAPYLPTPLIIVDRMLQLGALKPQEKMYDLGSGDGRIVIMAAEKYKADSVGVEYDYDLFRESQNKIKRLGLKNAGIVYGDILDRDYSDADLVTVYLLPASNEKVRPLLERQLKKGARVVAHDFGFAGWTPIKTETIDDDGEGRSHTLYLYQR